MATMWQGRHTGDRSPSAALARSLPPDCRWESLRSGGSPTSKLGMRHACEEAEDVTWLGCSPLVAHPCSSAVSRPLSWIRRNRGGLSR